MNIIAYDPDTGTWFGPFNNREEITVLMVSDAALEILQDSGKLPADGVGVAAIVPNATCRNGGAE